MFLPPELVIICVDVIAKVEGNIYAYVFFLLVEQTQETNFIAKMY